MHDERVLDLKWSISRRAASAAGMPYSETIAEIEKRWTTAAMSSPKQQVHLPEHLGALHSMQSMQKHICLEIRVTGRTLQVTGPENGRALGWTVK